VAREFAAAAGAPAIPNCARRDAAMTSRRRGFFVRRELRPIDPQPHDTYLKSRDFHSQHDAFRGALPFC
jgi:hypothetical protein